MSTTAAAGLKKLALRDQAEAGLSAYQNEQVTRLRVEQCEKQVALLTGLLARDFAGRLRWLLTGR